jgi:hypothetical protein
MSIKSDYINQQKKECAERWFKDHRSTFLSPEPFTIPLAGAVNDGQNAIAILWRNPESWNYGCHFIIHRNFLCVTGDIGEAVYGWGERLQLPFLAGINFGYFLEKCCASENGRDFKVWDSDIAWQNKEAYRTDEESLADDYRKCSSVGDLLRFDKNRPKEDWDGVIREIYDETGDGEFASICHEWGMVPNVGCIGHFVGLQMAIKQLIG